MTPLSKRLLPQWQFGNADRLGSSFLSKLEIRVSIFTACTLNHNPYTNNLTSHFFRILYLSFIVAFVLPKIIFIYLWRSLGSIIDLFFIVFHEFAIFHLPFHAFSVVILLFGSAEPFLPIFRVN